MYLSFIILKKTNSIFLKILSCFLLSCWLYWNSFLFENANFAEIALFRCLKIWYFVAFLENLLFNGLIFHFINLKYLNFFNIFIKFISVFLKEFFKFLLVLFSHFYSFFFFLIFFFFFHQFYLLFCSKFSQYWIKFLFFVFYFEKSLHFLRFFSKKIAILLILLFVF